MLIDARELVSVDARMSWGRAMPNRKKPEMEAVKQVSVGITGRQKMLLEEQYGKNISAAIRKAVDLLIFDVESKRKRLQLLRAEVAELEAEIRALEDVEKAEEAQYQEQLGATEAIRRSIDYRHDVTKSANAIRYLFDQLCTEEFEDKVSEDAGIISKNHAVPIAIVLADLKEAYYVNAE